MSPKQMAKQTQNRQLTIDTLNHPEKWSTLYVPVVRMVPQPTDISIQMPNCGAYMEAGIVPAPKVTGLNAATAVFPLNRRQSTTATIISPQFNSVGYHGCLDCERCCLYETVDQLVDAGWWLRHTVSFEKDGKRYLTDVLWSPSERNAELLHFPKEVRKLIRKVIADKQKQQKESQQ